MSEHVMAALVVVLAWWASTGVVLRLVWMAPRTRPVSVGALSILGLLGLYVMHRTAHLTTELGAYVAFGGALAAWAWHELVFLLGWITGPRREACPPEARGLRRFRYATATLIHHEVVLAATFALVVALTWRAPNQVASLTFGVLWVMRLSAKFNVYFGVRNLTEEFVPPHLRYLTSYFTRAAMNPLMPVSLLAGTAGVAVLAHNALAPAADGFGVTGYTLVATILTLAVVEHLCLVLPLPDAWLWRWVVKDLRQEARQDV